jgi:hypothetical protein
MQQRIKITMDFSPAFYLKLKFVAQTEQKTLTQIVEEKLMPLLEAEEEVRLQEMYAALHAMEGICKEPITDASQTIDDILYGAGTVEKPNT